MHLEAKSTFETAVAYRNCGLNVIPVLRGGSKAPAIKQLKPYLTGKSTEEELKDWFLSNVNAPE